MLCGRIYTCILGEIQIQGIDRQHKNILCGKPKNLTLEGQPYPLPPTYGISKNLSSGLFDMFLESEPLGNSCHIFSCPSPLPNRAGTALFVLCN